MFDWLIVCEQNISWTTTQIFIRHTSTNTQTSDLKHTKNAINSGHFRCYSKKWCGCSWDWSSKPMNTKELTTELTLPVSKIYFETLDEFNWNLWEIFIEFTFITDKPLKQNIFKISVSVWGQQGQHYTAY